MDNPDEVVPEKFVGCTIDWAAGKDTTGRDSDAFLCSDGLKGASAYIPVCVCEARGLHDRLGSRQGHNR